LILDPTIYFQINQDFVYHMSWNESYPGDYTQFFLFSQFNFAKLIELLATLYKTVAHNLFAIAGRITFVFMNYGLQWDILYFTLLLLCFYTLSLPCLHTSVWPSFY